MATAKPFRALGAGNGFHACLPAVDVSSMNWVAPMTLEEAMRAFYLLRSVEGNVQAVRSLYGLSSSVTQLVTASQPHEKSCGFNLESETDSDFFDDPEDDFFAQTSAIIRRYGSNYFRRLFDSNDFLGYGVQPGWIRATASWGTSFEGLDAWVSLGSYSGEAITDITDIAIIDLGGLPWVAVAYGETSRNAENLTATSPDLSASLSALGFWTFD